MGAFELSCLESRGRAVAAGSRPETCRETKKLGP